MMAQLKAAAQQQTPSGEISYVGIGTAAEAAATINLDAGHANGDLLILTLTVGSNNIPSMSNDGGWTQIWGVSGQAGPDSGGAMWARFADGTESATVTPDGTYSGVCLAYRGVGGMPATTFGNDARATRANVYNYTGALPAFSDGNWLVSGLGSGASIRDVSAAPAGSTLLLNLFSTATLAVAHQGPVASAPAAALWTVTGSGRFCCGVAVLKP